MIRLLISKGVERNSRSKFGWTAPMQAATKGRPAEKICTGGVSDPASRYVYPFR
jgi:hypothetical protein